MKILWHFLILLFSFIIAFAWAETFFVDYTIQGLGILILFYLGLSVIRKKINAQSPSFGHDSDIFILTIAVLMVITITGNLYSPLFFLLYFLGFGITFIFEPASVFIFALGVVIMFLPQVLKNQSIESYLRLGSILLISPLAFFFGQEYRDRDAQEEEITQMKERESDAADTIATDIEDVLKDEKQSLKGKDVEKLNEILEEAEDLREEAKESNT